MGCGQHQHRSEHVPVQLQRSCWSVVQRTGDGLLHAVHELQGRVDWIGQLDRLGGDQRARGRIGAEGSDQRTTGARGAQRRADDELTRQQRQQEVVVHGTATSNSFEVAVLFALGAVKSQSLHQDWLCPARSVAQIDACNDSSIG